LANVILRQQPREQSWELERNAARGGGVHERISIFAAVFGFFDLDQSRSLIQLQDVVEHWHESISRCQLVAPTPPI
jgi:hypothetical protein